MTRARFLVALGAPLIFGFGCGRSSVSNSEMKSAIAELESMANAQSGDTKERVLAAATALQAEKHMEAAANLQSLVISPGTLNQQQQQTVTDAFVTLQRLLAGRAQKGDTEAEKVLLEIRETKVPPRP